VIEIVVSGLGAIDEFTTLMVDKGLGESAVDLISDDSGKRKFGMFTMPEVSKFDNKYSVPLRKVSVMLDLHLGYKGESYFTFQGIIITRL
jgi:hypothetical protein